MCCLWEQRREFCTTQLFGHVKGAYTGADKDQNGVLERVHQGTVFLYEIHCLSPSAQRTLLRTIETKRVAQFEKKIIFKNLLTSLSLETKFQWKSYQPSHHQ
ncbi:MAG: sigma 54-interacting transcriptional regulator [Bdellovibrionota bacterium]